LLHIEFTLDDYIHRLFKLLVEAEGTSKIDFFGHDSIGRHRALGRLILRLVEPTAGTIFFNGQNLVGLAGSTLRRYRGADAGAQRYRERGTGNL
jgi:ABC-type proline/glycine betaine transport system ATPase subunit